MRAEITNDERKMHDQPCRAVIAEDMLAYNPCGDNVKTEMGKFTKIADKVDKSAAGNFTCFFRKRMVMI